MMMIPTCTYMLTRMQTISCFTSTLPLSLFSPSLPLSLSLPPSLSQDGKIVEDMYIPGKGERYIVKGFEVIKKTVEGIE